MRTRRSNNHNPASPSGNVSPANGLSPNSGVRRLQNDSRHQSLPAIVNDSTVPPAVGMNNNFVCINFLSLSFFYVSGLVLIYIRYISNKRTMIFKTNQILSLVIFLFFSDNSELNN